MKKDIKDVFDDYWFALIKETQHNVVSDVVNHYSNFIKKMFTKVGITRLDVEKLVIYERTEDIHYRNVIVRTIEYDTKNDIINLYYEDETKLGYCEDDYKVSKRTLWEFAANNDDTYGTLDAISSSVIVNIWKKHKDKIEKIFRKVNEEYEQV